MKGNKKRGYLLEREIVSLAEKSGLKAIRAWGSNGKALGLTENVDVLLETVLGSFYIQAKRKKHISEQYLPDDNIHAQVIRQDRDEPYAVIKLELLLKLLGRSKYGIFKKG